MDLSWNKLGPLMTVPYLPTLGALHPRALGPRLLREVLDVAGTGRWLPHDKDQRWGGAKDEHILDATGSGGDHVLVTTLTRRGAGTIKVHLYGEPTPAAVAGARAVAHRLAGDHRAGAARVVWFLPPGRPPTKLGAATRVQLRTFDPTAQVGPPGAVTAYDRLPAAVAATFAAFAETMAGDGFGYLYLRMRSADPGPVLTVVRDQRVVGALGPMSILADPVGAPRLLPQYFGVLPDHRRLGLGRALWRAAMAWGQAHGAAYQILNTVIDGASDRLCRAEGLDDLGVICTA